ncbi:hypothetical protein [Hyphococcus sp.]|uniref:hypothetical protein n=1 Tax=Hyphococcus sp. TaxID=2038636 RepID=UPI00208B751F|nr:MAG: hypothetical protein DHS20C04_29360 [Marinicaulis sp.]
MDAFNNFIGNYSHLVSFVAAVGTFLAALAALASVQAAIRIQRFNLSIESFLLEHPNSSLRTTNAQKVLSTNNAKIIVLIRNRGLREISVNPYSFVVEIPFSEKRFFLTPRPVASGEFSNEIKPGQRAEYILMSKDDLESILDSVALNWFPRVRLKRAKIKFIDPLGRKMISKSDHGISHLVNQVAKKYEPFLGR